MIYNELTDNLMSYFSKEEFQSDIETAKNNFFQIAGIMDESRSDFEMKMTQFVDWFLFSRPLKDKELRPIDYVFQTDEFPITKENEEHYKNLSANRHSLFEFLKVSKNDLYIKDLFSGYKHIIKDSPITVGFNKGDIFEARLIPHEDSFIFSSAFCFHPPGAKKFILSQVKLINKMKKISPEEKFQKQEDLMLKLFQMKNKYDHYQHVQLNRIYTEVI